MGLKFINSIENDMALVQDALENAQSPAVRASLQALIAYLNGSMWHGALDMRLAGYPLAPQERRAAAVDPMCEEPADWF